MLVCAACMRMRHDNQTFQPLLDSSVHRNHCEGPGPKLRSCIFAWAFQSKRQAFRTVKRTFMSRHTRQFQIGHINGCHQEASVCCHLNSQSEAPPLTGDCKLDQFRLPLKQILQIPSIHHNFFPPMLFVLRQFCSQRKKQNPESAIEVLRIIYFRGQNSKFIVSMVVLQNRRLRFKQKIIPQYFVSI